jgi:hypothetical protein
LIVFAMHSTAALSAIDISCSPRFPGANVSPRSSVAERAGWPPLVKEPICRFMMLDLTEKETNAR